MTLKKNIKKALRKIFESSFVMNLISAVFYRYAVFVGNHTRWTKEGVEKCYELWNKNDGFILVAWHGRALMLPYFWNGSKPLNALVSLHRDGRMIAGLLERFGLGTIGGSSNENANGAAFELLKSLQKDTAICIIPDGPRGPRMHLTKSPLYFAQKTGKPLIGATYSVEKHKFVTRSWDCMMIPLPFGKGIVKTTEPLFVPADADKETFENLRLEMEKRLNEINFECDRLMGIDPVQPSEQIGSKRHNKRN